MLIKTCAESDLGRSRSVNEDFFFVDEQGAFLLVADGMGGHGNGEVASRIAVEAMTSYLRTNAVASRPWHTQADRMSRNVHRLRAAVTAANREVLAEVRRDGSLAGMGATLVALLVDGNKGLIAHVGDSRAYRLRDEKLVQLTEDHTWVHEQVAAGLLSEDEARLHPFRSVVTRAVGGGDDVEVDIDEIDLEDGDLFLLCSDGLNAVLADDEIADHLRRQQPLEAVPRQLIDAANEGGGPDNITVVLASVAAG